MTSGRPERGAGEQHVQKSRLETAKLRALAAARAGVSTEDLPTGPDGGQPAVAGLVAVNGRAYGLADAIEDLGSLLHRFARLRKGGEPVPDGLTVFAEPDVAPALARRVAVLESVGLVVELEVLQVRGAEAIAVVPAELASPPSLSAERWQEASIMADAGARVIDDHGRLVADVMGLEVARITSEGLRIGVGEADRELQVYVNSHLEDIEALTRAADTVRSLRPQASHPLNRLARPRWLRSALLDDPSLIGLPNLEPIPPLVANEGVFDTEPTAAYSPPTGDEPGVTVVCSVGVDLNLVPEALEYRERTDGESRLILVVPERDRALSVAPMQSLLADSSLIETCSIQAPWESVRS